MLKSVGVLSIVFTLAMVPAALADECYDAVLDYNTALSRLNDTMDRFRTCVADSKGTDTCSKEFNELSAAQGQFAAAVTIYLKQCR